MFELPIDDRLSSWVLLRSELETHVDPLQYVFDFWKDAPYIAYNRKVDPYYQSSWPSPWEIIVENKYDEFTRALMIAYSLKFTKRFNDSVIELRTLVDNANNKCYNIVCVDNDWVINYADNVVKFDIIPDTFLVENLIRVESLR
jgi:hypothetical protein